MVLEADYLIGRRPACPLRRSWLTVSAELRDHRRVTDATFKAAVDLLGEKGVMDLLAVAAHYDLVFMVLNVDRYPLPDGEKPPFPEPQ